MRSDTTKYILGFLLAVGLIVVVIVLLVRSLVSTPAPSTSVTQPSAQPTLADYATNATTVQLTIDSPIVAPADHREVVVNVGKDKTELTVTKGYDGKVVRSKSYPMTETAYKTFLTSLMLNGFTRGNADPSLKSETGHCALGDRYIYQIIDGNGQTVERFWSTSCGTGNFSGDIPIIRDLFRLQIPDYFDLTSDIQF